MTSTRTYHTIPTSGEGSSGTNYDQTDFDHDTVGRQNRVETPGGTITSTVFDDRNLPTKVYIGTDDTGATDSDPTGGGAGGNNMVLVAENQYDAGSDGGNGHLTQQTAHVDSSTTRVTTQTYDYRGRRLTTDGEEDFFEKSYYDNLGRVIKSERYDTTAEGNLIARSEVLYDDRGRACQTKRYAVDPSDGSVGNALVSNSWYDASGRTIKEQPAGSEQFIKTVYDGAGRKVKQYKGFDLDETSYADASTVTGDTVIEQTEQTHDDAGNVIQTTVRQRFHNATGTGELTTASGSQPKARVTHAAAWPNGIGRVQATANYGTYGGNSFERPNIIPQRTDTILVTSTEYDSAGNMLSQDNPAGRSTRFEYDGAGRRTKQIMNFVPASSSSSTSVTDCSASDDTNVSVETAYNADGNVSSITAVNSATGNQTTQYIYGTTLTDSDVAMSSLKRAEIYPDSDDTAALGDGTDETYDRIEFKYNRQGQPTEIKDQQGTLHAMEYDGLGRQTHDRVTTLGSGVDGAVRRISTTYEVRGMKEKLTSYDNATVGSGSVDSEVQFSYNDFRQVSVDYQEHGGAVNTATSPKVQYGYAGGSDNTIRPTTLTYPDGRVLTYDYGSGGGADDALSRVAALVDDDGGSTHLVDYSYLGRRTFVEADYTEPDLRYTLVGTAGGNDPDTGDIYRGLDRFGRVTDSMWYDYGASADADRVKHGYDLQGSRTFREQTVDSSSNHDEFYSHDLIDRLKQMDRGTLSAQKDGISSLNFAQCWSLDSTGNWGTFKQDDNGNATWDLEQSRTSNEANEITDITEAIGASWITPTYNRTGNMTTVPKPSDPTTGYTATYDAWNRLVRLEDGEDTVAEYRYDGAKRRIVKKTYDGGVLDETRHLYLSTPLTGRVLEERVNASTSPDHQFIWGSRHIDDLVLRDRDTSSPKNGTLDERLYAIQDANWNVTSVAATDGTIQERYACEPYGTSRVLTPAFATRGTSSYDWETRFAGYRWDSESGFCAVRARTYSPLSSWLQRDPAGFVDGANLYEYVRSNPLGLVDPTGLGVCDWLTSPCFGNAASCACSIIGLIDAALNFLPPGSLAGWDRLITGLSSLADCACDLLVGPATSLCFMDDGCGALPGFSLSFEAQLFSCAFNIFQGIVGIPWDIDAAALQALIDLILSTLDELGVAIEGIGGSGNTTGFEACFNIDCSPTLWDRGPAPPIPPIVFA